MIVRRLLLPVTVFAAGLGLGLAARPPNEARATDRTDGLPGATSSRHLSPRVAPAGAYRADILRVIDGDTVEARVHVWLGQEVVTGIRLAGIDAPELKGRCAAERSRALAARDALASLVEGRTVTLAAISPDKYFARVVGRIVLADGGDAAAKLLDSGHVRRYDGGHRDGWC